MSLFLRKNNLLRCWGWLSLPNRMVAVALTLSLLLKLPLWKLELWFILWSFFLLRLLCISINLPFRHTWNTAFMSGLVLLVATWDCWISYKRICRTVSLSLPSSFEHFAHCSNVASLKVFSIGITLVDVHPNWLNWFHFLIRKGHLFS